MSQFNHRQQNWDEARITVRGEALFTHTFGKWPYPHATGA
jgi:hypothetical protein